MNTKRNSNKAGFTLIEILIVLVVMAVLASILLAVFARVREKGRSAVCQSNLKQLALAMQQYVQDSDGRFPPMMYVLNRDTSTAKVVHWSDALMPYVKVNAVFQCPTSGARDQQEPDYAYNWSQRNDIVWSSNRDPRRNQMVGSHESKPVFVSTVVLNFDASGQHGDGSTFNGGYVETSCGSQFVSNLHSGGANHSFIDGHVKWLSQAQQGEMSCKPTK